jgi:hypothetical protein
MSKFWTTLKTEQISKWEHVLLDVLVFEDEKAGMITVPAKFETDYASIRSLHNILLFVLYALVAGYGNYSATVHDYLYSVRNLSRKDCDDILYRALRAEGVAKWRAWLFWAGVRIGGAKSYAAAKQP